MFEKSINQDDDNRLPQTVIFCDYTLNILRKNQQNLKTRHRKKEKTEIKWKKINEIPQVAANQQSKKRSHLIITEKDSRLNVPYIFIVGNLVILVSDTLTN